MKLSPTWLREFVDPKVDNVHLAQDLTSVGIAVESISGEGPHAVFEMEIGTNRPDAMNHYGVAREASAIYNLPLPAVPSKLPAAAGKPGFVVPGLIAAVVAELIMGRSSVTAYQHAATHDDETQSATH